MDNLNPQLQKTLLAEFRSKTCQSCLEFSQLELKCTMVDKHSSEYYSDIDFSCPIGEF